MYGIVHIVEDKIMKKILQQVRLLMRVYKDYRVIITPRHIELKISPKRHDENEINWVVPNDKDGKIQLFFSLSDLLDKHSIYNEIQYP